MKCIHAMFQIPKHANDFLSNFSISGNHPCQIYLFSFPEEASLLRPIPGIGINARFQIPDPSAHLKIQNSNSKFK